MGVDEPYYIERHGGKYYDQSKADKYLKKCSRMNREFSKKCSKCGIVKPITAENFYRDKNCKDGFKQVCKKCMKKTYREKKMIHRPQSIEELIGQIEVMAKLYEGWNSLKRLETITLNIFKKDWGMDRFREKQIDKIRSHIPEMIILLENIINLFKKDIETMKWV